LLIWNIEFVKKGVLLLFLEIRI